MKINEIFYSIQGEGRYIGLPMGFVRVTGCNLRCQWCDTKYAYDEGAELSVLDILDRLRLYPTKNVCLTGGEPMAQKDTIEFINQLINYGYTIFLETNGSIFLGTLLRSNAIRISLDIKCPSSGESEKMNFTNLELLDHNDQVKFIIADDHDYEFAKDIIKKYAIDKTCNIIFTPCDTHTIGKAEPERSLRVLAERVLKDGLGVQVLPQLHKLIWPDKKRSI